MIVNGVAFDEDGAIRELDTPYPGDNLFSLASGGAIYVRDPQGLHTDDQLNGGEYARGCHPAPIDTVLAVMHKPIVC